MKRVETLIGLTAAQCWAGAAWLPLISNGEITQPLKWLALSENSFDHFHIFHGVFLYYLAAFERNGEKKIESRVFSEQPRGHL